MIIIIFKNLELEQVHVFSFLVFFFFFFNLFG
jgi:hypothetical protein